MSQDEWNVLTYVQRYQQRYRVPAKLSDIQHGCGLMSKRATWDVIKRLEQAGLVTFKFAKQVNWRVSLTGHGTVGFAPKGVECDRAIAE